uniref:RRM domain-containing protein n=1 Tax=Parascaris equorum TaxID=6256 RepID=A0A914RIW0_PAREQ
MADPSGEDGDLRLEEDDILDGGSDLATSGDHMSEDPDMEALTNRMKEIEEEAQLIRQMQNDVDYCSTAEELEAHFHGCGSVNRVTILTDKYTGHPKG